MFKKILILAVVGIAALLALITLNPTHTLFAQGTATPTSIGLGSFLGGSSAATTPTPTPAVVDPVRAELIAENHVVISDGFWYDTASKPVSDTVHVFMVADSNDPKSAANIKQLAEGFVALRTAYPTATAYHVLLLSGPNVFDASTTANKLALLSSKVITADAWLADVMSGMRTVNLVSGGALSTNATATPTRPPATPTRFATRVPTKPATTCNAPADKARLWVKNGYTGVMRFTVGGGEWGTHDFDIPADSQYHFIDMPTGRYTYTASIPGVGKANGERTDYTAGQCYFLTFSP